MVSINGFENSTDFQVQRHLSNDLVSMNDHGDPVTTSLAIADGVGNPHASVIRLIRENQGDLEEFGPLGFEIHVVKRTQGGGSPTEYAILNEQQATLLLTYMRNNKVVKRFKKRLVKAFYDLVRIARTSTHQDRPNFDPSSLSRLDILKMAIDSERERLVLEQKVQQDAPLVAFARKIEITPDSMTVAQAAKIIGTGRTRLYAFLRQEGWVTRHNEPYQSKIETGYLDVKISEWEHPEKGIQKCITTLITGKGLSRLHEIWSKRASEMASIGQAYLDGIDSAGG